MKPNIDNQEKLKRSHEVKFRFNDYEFDAFQRYCKKYKILNKSRFFRETIMNAVLQRFDEDYPSLFDAPVSNND
ncbi:MAG: hypothetical protein U9N85_03855 [Bacteroidota bacterium]|nr:hypothetical protein [Bacteroidota bacterium]